jgi:hypothetical protein
MPSARKDNCPPGIFAAIRIDLVRIELTLRFPTFGELFAAVFVAAIAIASAPGVEAKGYGVTGCLAKSL